jgi:hypothetical protein
VGQKHGGWVGFMQDHVLSSIRCVWFNRGESEDKRAVADRMVRHVRDPSNARFPLLIFPEGTCVNNEYVVQFKKFVFELGVPIHPIAIKYNKVFVDAYWNSREKSFHYHLFRLMSSWCVVVDVWFLDPQRIRAGESGAAFATRIQRMIADRASLRPVAWDGYMKCESSKRDYAIKAKLTFSRTNCPLYRLEAEPTLHHCTATVSRGGALRRNGHHRCSAAARIGSGRGGVAHGGGGGGGRSGCSGRCNCEPRPDRFC